MNILNKKSALEIFYNIGLPIPLQANKEYYEINLLFQHFKKVNSLLTQKKIQPLRIKLINEAHDFLTSSSLESAEQFICECALEQSEKSIAAAKKKKEEKEGINQEDIDKALRNYKKEKENTYATLDAIEHMSRDELEDCLTKNDRASKRIKEKSLSFFTHFDKVARPLVCISISETQFKVLGRALVNKKEQTGLELKEIKKNSPLGAIIEGGVALAQLFTGEKRANELHSIELQSKQLDLEIKRETLKQEKLKTTMMEIKVEQELTTLIHQSDIKTIEQIPDSFTRNRLQKAYMREDSNSRQVMNNYGLHLELGSTSIIDAKA
ncbi:hypothetical protein [Chitinibacter sp. GC72]|uniref:hypothetical protein n=1 Tax=Chitinibacter sp. GC72 TaxID=1526917 RepID=UPI0012F8BCB7|nr:hypothetical protein [Chitinibacter sp. GC72]